VDDMLRPEHFATRANRGSPRLFKREPLRLRSGAATKLGLASLLLSIGGSNPSISAKQTR
jgi:hypothetical protein